MYCSQCGAKASGRFCSECGAPLAAPSPDRTVPTDWSDEVRYDELLRIPQVRDLIARHAAQAKKQMSGEEFLKHCEKAFAPFGGVPLATVAAIIQPISANLGVKTGKTRAQVIQKPPGKVLVSLLCSLARHGQQLGQVQQAEDGCVLEASIPSDMWALEGGLLITVRREGTGTFVEAVTNIKGQLFDWGKSKRCLDALFADLDMTPAML